MKGVIVFKGRYGATAQYAEWLGHFLHVPVYQEDELSKTKLNQYDYVIAGTSVYVGKMLLAKWINSRKEILAHKKVYLFAVCATPSTESGELNDLLKKNIDPDLLQTMRVFFLRGRMIKSKLSFFDRIILHMGASRQKSKTEKKRMLTDFDDVRQDNLKEILNAVKADTLVEVS